MRVKSSVRRLIHRALGVAAASGLLLAGTGCFGVRPSAGGAQAETQGGERRPAAADVALPTGYRVEPIATGLTFPTGVAFDGSGRPYVVEAGYSYGEVFLPPRLLRIEPDGRTTAVATADSPDAGPWNGVVYYDGNFYIAEGGINRGGAITRISEDGHSIRRIVSGLPSVGDHHVGGPAVGPDGQLYFSVGTATNSGVVGTDNADYGWLKRHPEHHDIPARDITLTGENFETPNPLTEDKSDGVTTGAYVPFGTATTKGQVIKGQVPCTGGIFRISLKQPTDSAAPAGDGSSAPPAIDLVAWGLRNPFALAFDKNGRLFTTENSYDVRGSRPVWGTGDLLWNIDLSHPLWYGWPDFHGQRPLTRADWFKAPGEKELNFLLAEHPNAPPQPAAWMAVHAGAGGFDFAPASFGFEGQAFVAQFGDMSPGVGKVLTPVGFKLVRIEPQTGVIHDFAVNRGKENGPASKLKRSGLERPLACRFDPSGRSLYVVDFGGLTEDANGKPHPVQHTGVLWKITREAVVPITH